MPPPARDSKPRSGFAGGVYQRAGQRFGGEHMAARTAGGEDDERLAHSTSPAP